MLFLCWSAINLYLKSRVITDMKHHHSIIIKSLWETAIYIRISIFCLGCWDNTLGFLVLTAERLLFYIIRTLWWHDYVSIRSERQPFTLAELSEVTVLVLTLWDRYHQTLLIISPVLALTVEPLFTSSNNSVILGFPGPPFTSSDYSHQIKLLVFIIRLFS